MAEWAEIFRPSTPLVEILVRGTVMFLAIFVMLRIAGQREPGVHSLTDLLVVVLVAEAAAHGMAGEARGIADSVLLIATILAWSVALHAMAFYWPPIAPLIKPRARPLIVDGRIDRRALRREFMQEEELMAELHLNGVSDVRDVARAYLESNGMVSVIRASHADSQPHQQPRTTG